MTNRNIRTGRTALRGSDSARRSVDIEHGGQMVSASWHRAHEAKASAAVRGARTSYDEVEFDDDADFIHLDGMAGLS